MSARVATVAPIGVRARVRARGTFRPLRIVVAGGGFAALELLAAVRALADERVDVTIIAPTRELTYRPTSPGVAFGAAEVRSFDLDRIAGDHRATLRVDTVEAVAGEAHRLRTRSHRHLDYDALVLAAGARRRTAVPGALTFRHERDAGRVRAVLRRAARGAVRSVAFVVATGTTWPLPAYELALHAATWAEEHAPGLRVNVVTPERSPLEVLGDTAAAAVRGALRDAGVALFTDTRARGVARGHLMLDGAPMEVDAVIATARLEGVRFSGIPSDYSRFVLTDELGAVQGLDDVYAVGDLSGYPVKQGGLAAQQADAVAAVLAARAGVPVGVHPPTRSLRVRLAGGARPLFLSAELDARGRPRSGTSTAVKDRAPWWPPAKVYARHLAPYLARQQDSPAAAPEPTLPRSELPHAVDPDPRAVGFPAGNGRARRSHGSGARLDADGDRPPRI